MEDFCQQDPRMEKKINEDCCAFLPRYFLSPIAVPDFWQSSYSFEMGSSDKSVFFFFFLFFSFSLSFSFFFFLSFSFFFLFSFFLFSFFFFQFQFCILLSFYFLLIIFSTCIIFFYVFTVLTMYNNFHFVTPCFF